MEDIINEQIKTEIKTISSYKEFKEHYDDKKYMTMTEKYPTSIFATFKAPLLKMKEKELAAYNIVSLESDETNQKTTILDSNLKIDNKIIIEIQGRTCDVLLNMNYCFIKNAKDDYPEKKIINLNIGLKI